MSVWGAYQGGILHASTVRESIAYPPDEQHGRSPVQVFHPLRPLGKPPVFHPMQSVVTARRPLPKAPATASVDFASLRRPAASIIVFASTAESLDERRYTFAPVPGLSPVSAGIAFLIFLPQRKMNVVFADVLCPRHSFAPTLLGVNGENQKLVPEKNAIRTERGR